MPRLLVIILAHSNEKAPRLRKQDVRKGISSANIGIGRNVDFVGGRQSNVVVLHNMLVENKIKEGH
jgi:hypothetical protein